ncbi:ABC transporter permease [Streptococcus ferus]|uniref:ABC transporter permease n=1 Tax=Streptococcus ferus TaxID=1345 RepID=UPI0023563944|nr:ABC transporter permease [Streptococcus ferus]
MRLFAFSKRTAQEILRDPINLAFGVGFPVVLIFLLNAIQANIPVSLFQLNSFIPGIAVFGLTFMTVFSATLIAKDRESSFLQRLYTSPMTAMDFILGYAFPILPIALTQTLICYLVAIPLGLSFNLKTVYAILCILPISLFFIAVGLLCGSVLSVKQVGGICGALLTNLAGWLSGIWFDLDLIGGLFKKVAYALPFVHAVNLERMALNGFTKDSFSSLLWLLGYTLLTMFLAIYFFLRQMKNN